MDDNSKIFGGDHLPLRPSAHFSKNINSRPDGCLVFGLSFFVYSPGIKVLSGPLSHNRSISGILSYTHYENTDYSFWDYTLLKLRHDVDMLDHVNHSSK